MRDLRRYARQTNVRLIIGGFFMLYLVGLSLIYAIYGPAAALSGFICLTAGASPFILIALILWVLEKWAIWVDQDEG